MVLGGSTASQRVSHWLHYDMIRHQCPHSTGLPLRRYRPVKNTKKRLSLWSAIATRQTLPYFCCISHLESDNISLAFTVVVFFSVLQFIITSCTFCTGCTCMTSCWTPSATTVVSAALASVFAPSTLVDVAQYRMEHSFIKFVFKGRSWSAIFTCFWGANLAEIF